GCPSDEQSPAAESTGAPPPGPGFHARQGRDARPPESSRRGWYLRGPYPRTAGWARWRRGFRSSARGNRGRLPRSPSRRVGGPSEDGAAAWVIPPGSEPAKQAPEFAEGVHPGGRGGSPIATSVQREFEQRSTNHV